MTRNFITFLLFSLFIISCTDTKDAASEKRIMSLESENDSLATLAKEREAEMAKLQSHNANMEKLYVSQQELNVCAEESSKWLLDKTYLIEFMIDRYALASNAVLGELTVECLMCGSYYTIDNFSRLLKCMNRSSEMIEHFFSDKDKERIYALFEGNSIYQNCGLSALAEGLLFVYEEVKDDPEFLEDFGKVAYNDKAPNEERNKYYDISTSNLELNEILSDERYMDPNDLSYLSTRAWYVYTFWVRRHHEGNSEVVYELIKEIHEKLKLRPDLEFDYGDDYF